jgi:gluconokinase
MGVAGSGRTSAAGEALTDEDRWPWLVRLVGELAARDSAVLACSALRGAYRAVRSVFLDLDQADATERARARAGHYMGPGRVGTQFVTLERPAPDEGDGVDGVTGFLPEFLHRTPGD